MALESPRIRSHARPLLQTHLNLPAHRVAFVIPAAPMTFRRCMNIAACVEPGSFESLRGVLRAQSLKFLGRSVARFQRENEAADLAPVYQLFSTPLVIRTLANLFPFLFGNTHKCADGHRIEV